MLEAILEEVKSEQSYYKFNNAMKSLNQYGNAWKQLIYLACCSGNIGAFRILMLFPIVEDHDMRTAYFSFRLALAKLNWCPLFSGDLRVEFEEIISKVFRNTQNYGHFSIERFLGDTVLYELVSIASLDFFKTYLLNALRFPEAPAEIPVDAADPELSDSTDEDEPEEEPLNIDKETYYCYLELIKQAYLNPNAAQIIAILVERIQKNKPPFNVWNPLDNIIGEARYCFNYTKGLSQSAELINFISTHLTTTVDNLRYLFNALIEKRIGCDEESLYLFIKILASKKVITSLNSVSRQLFQSDDDGLITETIRFLASCDDMQVIETLLQPEELSPTQVIAVAKQALNCFEWGTVLDVILTYATTHSIAFNIDNIVKIIFEQKLAYSLSKEKLAWLHRHGVDFNQPVLSENQPPQYWQFEVADHDLIVIQTLAVSYKVGFAQRDHQGRNILHRILSTRQFTVNIINVCELVKQLGLVTLFRQVDNNGNTLFHSLFSNTSGIIHHDIAKIIAILKENGAVATTKNQQGQMPIDLIKIDIGNSEESKYNYQSLVERKVNILTALKIPVFDKQHGCINEFKTLMTSSMSITDLVKMFKYPYLLENANEFEALVNYIHDEMAAIFANDQDPFSHLLNLFRTEKCASGLFFTPRKKISAEQRTILSLLVKSPIFIYLYENARGKISYVECQRLMTLAQEAVARNDPFILIDYSKLAEDLFLKLSCAAKKLTV